MFPFIVRLGPHSFPHLSLIVVVNRNRRNSPPLVPAQCLSCNVFPLFVSSCVHSVTSSLMCLGPSPLSPRGPFFFCFSRVPRPALGRLSSGQLQLWAASPAPAPAPALGCQSSGQLQLWAASPAASSSSSSGPPVLRPAPALGRLSSSQLQLQLLGCHLGLIFYFFVCVWNGTLLLSPVKSIVFLMCIPFSLNC